MEKHLTQKIKGKHVGKWLGLNDTSSLYLGEPGGMYKILNEEGLSRVYVSLFSYRRKQKIQVPVFG